MAAPADHLSILIPPSPLHVASVRVFVAAVGRHFGCSDEVVEDLRLVASEACSQALRESPSDPIELRAWVEFDRLLLEIEPSGRFEGEAEDADLGVDERLALIRSLFPDANLGEHDGRPVLILSAQVQA